MYWYKYILPISPGYLIAWLSILFFYKTVKPSQLRLFAWFIPLEYLNQIACVSTFLFHNKGNYHLINIHIIISYTFYLFFFTKINTSRIAKRVSFFFLLSFVVVFTTEVFFFKNVFSYAAISDHIGRIFVFICSFSYLFLLLTKDEIINYFKVPMFWICTGILMSIIGDWIYMALFDFILKHKADKGGEINLAIIITTNNVQYFLFAIGFLCNKEWKRVR